MLLKICFLDRGLLQALFQSWNGLGWAIAHHFKLGEGMSERIKEARLIGPTGPIVSDQIGRGHFNF